VVWKIAFSALFAASEPTSLGAERYEDKMNALQRRAEDATADQPSKEEMAIGVDFGKWHILDVPEFTAKLQTWKLHVPEFRMSEKRWRFHMPEPCMRYVKIGTGGLHLPGICMREKTWFVKIPEVVTRLQTFKLHVPEVTMKRQRWVVDLPEIKIESAKGQGRQGAGRGQGGRRGSGVGSGRDEPGDQRRGARVPARSEGGGRRQVRRGDAHAGGRHRRRAGDREGRPARAAGVGAQGRAEFLAGIDAQLALVN
jgi:hypothetical protein